MVMEINRVHPFVVYSAIVSLFSCFALFFFIKKKKVVVAVLLHLICVIHLSLECYKLPFLGAKRPCGYLNEVVFTCYYFDECYKLHAIIECQNFTHIHLNYVRVEFYFKVAYPFKFSNSIFHVCSPMHIIDQHYKTIIEAAV